MIKKYRIIFLFVIVLMTSQFTFGQLDWVQTKLKISSEATAVKNSPDGRMAVGTANGSIFICNPITQGIDNTFTGQIGAVYQLSFSPDAGLLASCGKNGEVWVWDVKKGMQRYHLSEHKSTVLSISINFNGTLLATGDDEGKIIIWDLKTGKKIHSFDDHNKSIGELEFAHLSNLLACSDLEGVVEVYDVDKKEIVRKMSTNSKKINCIAWDPRDNFLATGDEDSEIKIWDVNLGYSTINLKGHKKPIKHLAYSPDGAFLFSISLDNTLKTWELKTSQVKNTLGGFYKLLDCHVSYDGQRLLTADYEQNAEFYNISNLGIAKNNDLNSYKNLFVTGSLVNDPPVIELIQPMILNNEKIITEEALYDVKGKVKASAGLFLLLVDGQETSVDENGYFKSRVQLEYAHNKISIKAIDVLKQVTEYNITLTRPMHANLIDKANLNRKGKDYALLIGTDKFDFMNNLSNPVNDVKTISAELRDRYGFEVDTLLNPTMNQIYNKIREYSKKEFSDQDQLFVFIAGHGEYDEVFKEGYVVCKNSDVKNDMAKSTFISHSNLRTLVNNIGCKHICLTLDVCFGGTFDPIIASRGDVNYSQAQKNEFIQRKLQYKTRLYITSGGKEYVPDGRPGQHSPFARQFLSALRSDGGEDGILTMIELQSFIETLSPQPKFGQFGNNEPGSDFLFIKK